MHVIKKSNHTARRLQKNTLRTVPKNPSHFFAKILNALFAFDHGTEYSIKQKQIFGCRL